MAPDAALAETGVEYELARVERDEEGRSPPAYVRLPGVEKMMEEQGLELPAFA